MMTLIKAELLLNLAHMRRYFLNTILSLAVMVLFFYGMFYGISLFVSAPLAGENLSSLVLGFVVWTFLLGILQGIAEDIQREAVQGTLEQLAMSKYGLMTILLVRSVLTVLVSLLPAGIIVALLVWITGAKLELRTSGLWSVLALGVGAMGLSLTLGALALYFKNVSMLFTIVQFGLLPYILALRSWDGWMVWIPLAPSLYLANTSFVLGSPANAQLTLFAFLNSASLVVLGWAAFAYSYGLVRKKGNLSMY